MFDVERSMFKPRTASLIAERHAAFTLIELLVVIALIAVLAALSAAGIARGIEEARRIQCLNNLKQMVLAAHVYAAEHDQSLPPSYVRTFSRSGQTETWESFLWEMGADFQIQQCPSFRGEAQWGDDKYTGYNYNSSYVGGRLLRRGEASLPGSAKSATLPAIKTPSQCALFGDGEYEKGANKFMRSPYPGALDFDASLAVAGTQGFRHRGRTNVGFADGHAESLSTRYTDTAAEAPAANCGFISPDNSLYDLD